MAKSLVKEIIIMLLLCLAIILILGVLLYEYVPSNKVLPDKVSYVPSEEVQKELDEAVALEESQIIMTYEINSSDLTNYEKINDYKPGKVNPFSSYKPEDTTTTQGQTSNSASGTSVQQEGSETGNVEGQAEQTSGEKNANSQGNTSSQENKNSYFQDKGTK